MAGTREWTPLSAERIEKYRRRLLEERQRLVRLLDPDGELYGASVTAADGDLTNWPFHLADQGTDAMEQETGFLLASRESRLLMHVDAALQRLYKTPETFGRCESCGQAIDRERLDAIPHVRLCIECMKSAESGRQAPVREARP